MKVYVNKTKLMLRMIVVGALAIFAVVGIILSLIFMYQEPFTAIIVIIALAFLLFAMLYTIKISFVRDKDEPVLIISEDGVFDKRILKAVVPWNNLEWRYVVVKGNPSICIDILDFEYEYAQKPGFLDHISFALAKVLGFPKYNVDLLSLKTRATDIREEFEKYKKPYDKSKRDSGI